MNIKKTLIDILDFSLIPIGCARLLTRGSYNFLEGLIRNPSKPEEEKEIMNNAALIIGREIPRATLESVIFSSPPIGALTATVGAGISYLLGYKDTSQSLFVYGSVSTLGGLFLIGLYSFLFPPSVEGNPNNNTALRNLYLAIENYKKLKYDGK